MLVKKRAIRRYHKARMKKKVVEAWGYPEAIKYADTMCACSRICCGNQRKWFGPSFRERRHKVD